MEELLAALLAVYALLRLVPGGPGSGHREPVAALHRRVKRGVTDGQEEIREEIKARDDLLPETFSVTKQ